MSGFVAMPTAGSAQGQNVAPLGFPMQAPCSYVVVGYPGTAMPQLAMAQPQPQVAQPIMPVFFNPGMSVAGMSVASMSMGICMAPSNTTCVTNTTMIKESLCALKTEDAEREHTVSTKAQTLLKALDTESNGRSSPPPPLMAPESLSRNRRGSSRSVPPRLVVEHVVALKYGRRRQARSDTRIAPGKEVVLVSSLGREIGVVADADPETVTWRKGDIRIVRVATPEERQEHKETAEEEEKKALMLARKLAEEMQVPIQVHCVTMQFDRRRLEFHYSSSEQHPDFRALLRELHLQLSPYRIWLNNCNPEEDCPGERIAPVFFPTTP
eukprot:Hpha_TRINITY_DN16276_c0_g2::TRINITY_DN16276_c0_g2_i1::g.15003::m.15003